MLLIGLIFSILGGVFTVLGTVFLLSLPETLGLIMGAAFGGVGSVFLAVGIIFLIGESRRKRRIKKLLEAGRYVWGEIIELAPNYNIRINGRNPYLAVVRHTDSRGQNHLFRSESLRIYPDPALVGKQVRIYIGDQTFHNYYVDLEAILPKYIEHSQNL